LCVIKVCQPTSCTTRTDPWSNWCTLCNSWSSPVGPGIR